MKMKNILFLLVMVFSVSVLFAQDVETDEFESPQDTAQQKLVTTSISKFEDPGLWYATMPRDQGIITLRRIDSAGSIEKEKLEDETEIGIEEQDNFVIGLKVEFFHRGLNEFYIHPVRPLPVEGISKTVSVYVIGRNMKHVLKLLISDQFGNKAEITMGQLNFSGWKKMTVAIPPTIIQKDYHYTNKTGIKIEGFKIDCDILESYGTYYIYFDALRANVDLFTEESRDVDDLQDGW